jgi:hypothetical protein
MAMIICPWCGTNYLTFQSNCKNCGGALQAVEENITSSVPTENLPTPPSAPRSISERYVWRLLSADGLWITALVLGLLGVVFSQLGAGLVIGIITGFVGIPILLLGVALLGMGGWVFIWRYQESQKVVDVLREGEATRGQIVEIQQDHSVSVNGQYPWVIRYQFEANGQDHEGKVTTLNQPGQRLQAGRAVCVLYLPTAPKWSSIYPHP